MSNVFCLLKVVEWGPADCRQHMLVGWWCTQVFCRGGGVFLKRGASIADRDWALYSELCDESLTAFEPEAGRWGVTQGVLAGVCVSLRAVHNS